MIPLAADPGETFAAALGVVVPVIGLLGYAAYFIRERQAHAALQAQLAKAAEAVASTPAPKDRWRFRRPPAGLRLRLEDTDQASRLELDDLDRIGGAPDLLLWLLALLFCGPLVFVGGILIVMPIREGVSSAGVAAAQVVGGLAVLGLGALFGRAILSVADRLAAIEGTPEGLVAETKRLGLLGRHRHRGTFQDPVRVRGKLQHWAAREERARRVYFLTLGGGLVGGTVFTVEDATAGSAMFELLVDRGERSGQL